MTETIQITEDEYRLADGNPMNIPRLREAMEVAMQHAESKQAQQFAPTTSDLRSTFMLGGRTCRPFSAGVMAVLEMIDHPLLKEDNALDDFSLADCNLMFWLLTEEPDTILDHVEAGTHQRAATRAAFALDQSALDEVAYFFGKSLAEMGGVFVDDSNEEAGQKKKTTGSRPIATA